METFFSSLHLHSHMCEPLLDRERYKSSVNFPASRFSVKCKVTKLHLVESASDWAVAC